MTLVLELPAEIESAVFPMNKIFSLALPALLALSLTLVARPAVAAPQTLTAQQVLDAAAQKYAGFSQYQGTCSILIDGESAIEGEPSQHLVSSANSVVDFERDKSLKVTGDSGFGGKFEALSTPASTTITVNGAGDKKMTLFQKDTLNKAETDEFLAGLTGVSGGGGATLPAMLLSDNTLNPLHAKGVVALLPTRSLGTTPCYIVTKTDAENKSVRTFWIEKDSFLLRRLEIEMGEMKSPAPTKEILEKYPQLKNMPAITTHYTNHILVFATQLAETAPWFLPRN